jgi:hypothetical protein
MVSFCSTVHAFRCLPIGSSTPNLAIFQDSVEEISRALSIEQATSIMEPLYSLPTAMPILSNRLFRKGKASNKISLFHHHGGDGLPIVQHESSARFL